MAMFADDTAIMAIGDTVENSTRKLQSAINKFTISTKKKANKIQRIQIDTY
jgi:phage gp45-like